MKSKRNIQFSKNRAVRLDEEEGRWVTTENGHKVHISEEGVPDKGNSHVLSKMEGKKPKESEGNSSKPKSQKGFSSYKKRREYKSKSPLGEHTFDEVYSAVHNGKESEETIQAVMDMVYDHPDTYVDLVERAPDDIKKRLKWELGPNNTNAIEEVIKPYQEKQKNQIKSKLGSPKKNQHTEAEIEGYTVRLFNQTDYGYGANAKAKRFYEYIIEDAETGEEIHRQARGDYESAIQDIYEKIS